MLRKTTVLAAFGLALAFAAPALAEERPLKDVSWSFQGPFGRFDQEQLQRGYKVYHDVCSNCHSMNLVTFGGMARPGGPFFNEKFPNPNDNPYVKTLAAEFKFNDIDGETGDVIQRPGTLTDDEKVRACVAAKNAGADFVKTSTGFSKGGATVADVALMRRTVGSELGVKASGGVKGLEDARKMVEAGATRIGASVGVKIAQEAAGKTPAVSKTLAY